MIEFITKKPRLAISFNNPNKIEITFEAPKSYAEEIQELQDDKELTISIKTRTKTRSLSQNAYLWVLLDEIAKKVDRTKTEIYREYIRDYGVFEIIPIKDEAVDSFITKWAKNGLGWISEKLDGSKLKGYTRIIAYFGTSSYTTSEMKRILDAVVRDCDELGIGTLELNEILSLANENDM